MENIYNYLRIIYKFMDTSQSINISGFICGSFPFITSSSLKYPIPLILNVLCNGFLGSLQANIISQLTLNKVNRLISIIFTMSAISQIYAVYNNQDNKPNDPSKHKVIKIIPLLKITFNK